MKTAAVQQTKKSGTSSRSPFFQKSGEESFFQTKLKINKPGDRFEVEADRVADHAVGNSGGNFEGRNQLQISAIQDTNTLSEKEDEQIQEKETPELQLSGLLGQKDVTVDDTGSEGFVQQKEGSDQSGISTDFESTLSAKNGSGNKLPDRTRADMEGSIGADFSGVRTHNDTTSHTMNNQLGAKAFTHGNDIYFNEGQYDTSSRGGRHLLAHELTHTVQQRASRQDNANVQKATKSSVIQTSLLDSIGSFFSSIRDRVVNFVESIPGFFLFTVLLGRNPLNDNHVERNGANFIKGFLLLLPNGQSRYNQLREEGALERSAAWIDAQMAELNVIQNMVSSAFSRAVGSIGATDVLDPGGALRRIRGYFSSVISRATSFAGRVALQVLGFLKDALLNSLVAFVRNQTRAYPLLRTLLGRDPITDEEVPRTMENIVYGFLMLTESGEAYYTRMMESGALPGAIAWMREQVASLPTLAEVVSAFTSAWRELSFEDLFQPVAAFTRIYRTLSDPVGRILAFVANVAWQILIFIKDAMLSWLQSQADNIPGYHLLTVLLGRDIFTNHQVPRTTANIIRGFMGLIPGGEQQFQQMQESGVIPRLTNRIESAIARLGITWDFIRNLFISIWDTMRITDLIVPILAFARIIARFREPLGRIVAFVGEVVMVIIEVILRMMNFPIDLIGQIIQNAMTAIEDIKRDPIGFLKNLLRAVKQGFQQFFDNFVQHLIGGVTGWLFGQLEEAGIQPPPDLSLRSILGMMMEVMGITVDNILDRLGRRIGQERVARIRSALDTLTGIWEFIRDVIERGPVAIWERIQSQISNLWNIIVDGIRNWIVTRIIQAVTTRLLSMLDPTGIMAVVNSFIAFYRVVQSFIEQLTRILQVINSFVQGVGEIARGSIASAANFLENALARALPVAIAFLANQVGLRGLGSRIAEMAERAREVVNSGIDWLIDRAISAGTAFLNMLTGGGGPSAQEHSPETQQQINTGVQAISQEEQRVAENGKVSRENAEVVAVNIRRNHPVFTSFVVVDGGDSWNYRYTASPEEEVDTATTKAEGDANGQNTDPVFGSKTNSFGTSVSVEFLAQGHDSGSEANSGLFTDHYEHLNKRLHSGGASRYYIRGHLLNNHLGGTGNDWKNLTPLKGAVNGQHERNFERSVKTAVEQGKQVKNFSVTAVYGRGQDSKTQDLLQGTRDFPEMEEKDFTSRELGEVLQAEQYVPLQLICSAKMINPETNAEESTTSSDPVTIEQNNGVLNYGDINAYKLGDISRRQRYSLKVIYDRAGGDVEIFKNTINSDLGINLTVAERLFNHFMANETISGRQWRQVMGITKSSIESDNPDKKIVGS